ncbi:MAG: Sec-independent protein translocase protein TatB [Pyrinomonadaceae bacterium]
MYLFILESIGTSELILIGIVALIFLGPRKLPEIARKAGKIMTEFRGTANEFKQTWEKEVNLEEETKALDLDTLDAEVIARNDPGPAPDASPGAPQAPAITAADPESFRDLAASSSASTAQAEAPPAAPKTTTSENDKKNWL